jgi:two-component system NtrC family sensor kinase
MLFCAPQQIEQALLAIEINAIEAMPEGGALKVEAHHSTTTDAIHISVADTGIGIPDDAMPHIFEPFFTTKENGKGTGLGLAVVYGIIERHGGTIDIQSKLHGGTTFTLRLPCTAPQVPNNASPPSLTLDNNHERQIN